ncbi:MAG: hypothetical protein DMG22_10595 [Acidobacteria bacterium]|nr:MAG: hypothetical protein DMG22_10595 [Acidobacteriota bacterium]
MNPPPRAGMPLGIFDCGKSNWVANFLQKNHAQSGTLGEASQARTCAPASHLLAERRIWH